MKPFSNSELKLSARGWDDDAQQRVHDGAAAQLTDEFVWALREESHLPLVALRRQVALQKARRGVSCYALRDSCYEKDRSLTLKPFSSLHCFWHI